MTSPSETGAPSSAAVVDQIPLRSSLTAKSIASCPACP